MSMHDPTGLDDLRLPSEAHAGQEQPSASFRLTQEEQRQPVQALLELVCEGRAGVGAEQAWPVPCAGPIRRAHDIPPGEICKVRVAVADTQEQFSEVDIVVRSDEGVWARRAGYLSRGEITAAEFVMPEGDIDIVVALGSSQPTGTALRVMQFNIWRSGTLEEQQGAGREGPQQNLGQLIEYVASESPGIVFVTEVYGSGETIRDGLNAHVPSGPRYQAVQVTTGPIGPSRDNLWIFTRLPVLEVYPTEGDGELGDFNFGGARLALPDGRHVHAFATWLHHDGDSADALDHAALEEHHGFPRSLTDDEVIGTDLDRRLGQACELLEERLPSYVCDDAPIIIGGDLNTAPAQDWTEQFADAPGHAGLTLSWPVTRMFDDAGFVDTYRWANADAGRHTGRTWSPLKGFTFGPMRMDYLYTRGAAVRVLSSRTVCERLPEHRGTQLSLAYPFYSDHCAVVSDLMITGGSSPVATPPYVDDEPLAVRREWPETPAGRPVPPNELSATSEVTQSGSEPRFAVDGDITTLWDDADPPPLPHFITIDMQRVRRLSALRYQPRVTGSMMGTITQATLEVSEDGENWRVISHVAWAWDRLPKDVALSGESARYLRLTNRWGLDFLSGTGAFTSAAEITPYEVDE